MRRPACRKCGSCSLRRTCARCSASFQEVYEAVGSVPKKPNAYPRTLRGQTRRNEATRWARGREPFSLL